MPPTNAPLILCGPIVRRVDRSSVSVFVVLRDAREVTLRVSAANELMSGSRSTIEIGRGVHAVTVTARASNALEWGKKYHYDLEFGISGQSGSKQKLYDDGVLVASVANANPLDLLVYEGESLPSFVLPPADIEKLCLWHGSCRKPHGHGRDALRRADDLLAESIRDSARRQRPQQMFFTGDQIYADDVDGELITFLADFAHSSRDDSVHGPRKVMVQTAGLTSNEGDNHLVTLGEFYGMYLFAWSQVPWTKKPKGGEVASFYNDLPYVRRVLANIATYMMFDDHEVTDDWYLSEAWCNTVLREKSLGRRVVRNALIAYAVFQHWGNAPEQFEGNMPGARLLRLIEHWPSGDEVRSPEIERLLGMPKSGAELAAKKQDALVWDYRWEGPTYEVIVLDTRTRRSFESNGTHLMTKAHIDEDLAVRTNPQFTLVISPAPVLGLTRLEGLQGIAAALRLEMRFDVECWARSNSFKHLINRLLERSPAVILSGDVHFGLSAQILDKDPQRPRSIVNFTSSALKNAPSSWWARQGLGALGGGPLRDLQIGGDAVAFLAPTVDVEAPVERTENVAIEGTEFEETLLVGSAAEDDEVIFAEQRRPQDNIDNVTESNAPAPLGAPAPPVHTVATPWTNFGEIRITSDKKIVQTLCYNDEGNWRTRADASTFNLRS